MRDSDAGGGERIARARTTSRTTSRTLGWLTADGGPQRWERWFLALAVPFGLLLFAIQPLAATPDAVNHTLRIDQIARGQLVSPRNYRGQASTVPGRCLYGYARRLTYTGIEWHLGAWYETAGCTEPRSMTISNTGVNSPVTYLPGLAGYEIGRLTGNVVVAVVLLRLFTLAAYIAGAWWAIRLSEHGKPFLFLAALVPTALAVAAGVSGDPVANALALLAVALTLRLSGPHIEPVAARRLLLGLGCVLPLLCLAKNIYAPFAFLVLLVPRAAFRSDLRRLRYAATVLLTSLVPVVLWSSLVVSRITQLSAWPRNGRTFTSIIYDPHQMFLLTSQQQVAWIRHHPLGFVHILLRSIANATTWNNAAHGMFGGVWTRFHVIPPPDVLLGLTLLSTVIAVGADVHRRRTPGPPGRRWTILVPAAIVAATTVLVFGGEALAVTPPLGWFPHITWIEGRFFIPLLPLVLLPVAARTTSRPTRRLVWAVPVISATGLAWVAATTAVNVF